MQTSHRVLSRIMGDADVELTARCIKEIEEDGVLHTDTYMKANNAGVDIKALHKISGVIYELTEFKDEEEGA